MEDKKDELTITKGKQEKEREQKKNSLIKALEGVVIKSVDINSVLKEYTSVLEEYCSTVQPEIDSIWEAAQKSGNPTEYIKKHMQKHCKDHLFTVAYESEDGIRNKIVKTLSQNANDYKAKLQEIVKEKEQDLSDVAQQELGDIFDSIETPSFVEVSIKGNELFNIFAQLPIIKSFFEEKYKESIALYICKQLRSQRGGIIKRDRLGVFAEQCIQQPVKAYYEQARKWKTEHLERIKGTLANENYILSQYDSHILELERQIDDLERRLNNLCDVSEELETVLSIVEGKNNE